MIASFCNKPLPPPPFFLLIAYLYQVLSDAIYIIIIIIIIIKLSAYLVRNQNLIAIASSNIDFKLRKFLSARRSSVTNAISVDIVILNGGSAFINELLDIDIVT